MDPKTKISTKVTSLSLSPSPSLSPPSLSCVVQAHPCPGQHISDSDLSPKEPLLVLGQVSKLVQWLCRSVRPDLQADGTRDGRTDGRRRSRRRGRSLLRTTGTNMGLWEEKEEEEEEEEEEGSLLKILMHNTEALYPSHAGVKGCCWNRRRRRRLAWTVLGAF